MCDSIDNPMNVKLIRVTYNRLYLYRAAKWIINLSPHYFNDEKFYGIKVLVRGSLFNCFSKPTTALYAGKKQKQQTV